MQLSIANDLAARRGSTRFTANDILFQLRHDPARIGRLREYLRWRRIRSAATKSSSQDDDVVGGGDDLLDDDAPSLEEIFSRDSDSDTDINNGGVKNINNKRPRVVVSAGATAAETNGMAIIQLPWSVTSFFPYASELFPDMDFDNEEEEEGTSLLSSLQQDGLKSGVGVSGSGSTPKDNDDEVNISSSSNSNNKSDSDSKNNINNSKNISSGRNSRLARLVENDKRTSTMTAHEYHLWTEARISSFSHRKKSIFRAWCGLGMVADHNKSADEIPGLLNMLACEWVQILTEEALRVQSWENGIWRAQSQVQGERVMLNCTGTSKGQGPFVFAESSAMALVARVDTCGEVCNEKIPLVEPRHVRIAAERLQRTRKRAGVMFNGTGLSRYKRLRLK